MHLEKSRSQYILVVLYSSILISVIEILFLKFSPQIYSIFNSLPFLLVGLCLRIKEFLLSVILSFFILTVLNQISPDIFINDKVLMYHLIVSSIIVTFFGICFLAERIRLNASEVISLLNLFFLFIFLTFYFLFFDQIQEEEIKSFLLKLISNILNSKDINNDSKDMVKIINTIFLILPSINSLIFFITFSFNYIFACFILEKNNFSKTFNYSFNKFSTPVWFSCIYLIFILISFSVKFNSSAWIIFTNAIICMSFCYLLEGYRKFINYFKKTNLNNFFKFLIIFLLFIFLGYVLLLIILFLGYFENFKKLRKKK